MTQQATESVFSATPATNATPASSTPDAGTNSAQKGLYSELVGEGKKYKDAEALAKSKMEADTFIERLKSEKEEVVKELQKKLEAEQILEDLKKQISAGNQPPATSQPQSAPTSPEELGRLVDERIQETEVRRAYDKNVAEADQFITSKFGGKPEATKFIEAKSEEFGVSKSWLMDMAGRNPKALYKLLGVEAPNPNAAQPPIVQKSTVKMDREPPSGSKTKSHYDDIRRTNPSLYFSPKIQKEIFESAKAGRYE